MDKLNKLICILAVLCCIAASNGTTAQESINPESVVTKVTDVPADTAVSVEKECIDANGAGVCWLEFKDGTRCVVAHDPDSGDASPAIACQFGSPLEKLRHMPRR